MQNSPSCNPWLFLEKAAKVRRAVVLTVSTARKSDTTSSQFTEGKHCKCSEVFAVSRNVKAGRRSKEWQNKERNIPACNKLEKLCQNISPGRTLYFWHLHKKNFPYSSIKMFHSFAPKCLHISAANIALVCARGFCSKTYIRAAVSKSLSRKRSVIGIGKYGKVIQPESILYSNWIFQITAVSWIVMEMVVVINAKVWEHYLSNQPW